MLLEGKSGLKPGKQVYKLTSERCSSGLFLKTPIPENDVAIRITIT